MGRHAVDGGPSALYAVAAPLARRLRHPWELPAYAFLVAFGILVIMVLAPHTSALAAEDDTGAAVPTASREVQSLDLSGHESSSPAIVRDDYRASKPILGAPVVGTPDPGSAQAIALELLLARGWDQQQFNCLVALWHRESSWNHLAENKSSGAYGIPQALPGSKMASAGADWRTNPRTQIVWGLGYIEARYQTPCGAWAAFQSKGWY